MVETATHRPATWFREHDGTIHWRCMDCHEAIADPRKPLPCLGIVAPEPTRTSHQLGYVVRASWVNWARREVTNPKPHWLVPYQDLSIEDQRADQLIGWDMTQWVLKQLIDYRNARSTEGMVCRNLGIDRMAWRDLRDQMGLMQSDEEAPR